KRDYRVHLPAFEQLCPGFDRRQVVGKRQRESLPNIEIACGSLEIRASAILRLGRAVKRNKVDRVRPRVTHNKAETVRRALRKRRLKPVVVRPVTVLEEVDVSKKRELRVERPARLFAAVVIRHINLIDVAYVVQLDAVIPNVADLNGGVGPKDLLNIEAPLNHVRRAQLMPNSKNIARSAALTRIAVELDIEDRTRRRPVQPRSLSRRRADDCAFDVRSDRSRRYNVETRSGRIVDSVLAEENGQNGNLVGDAPTGTDNRAALPGNIPHQAKTRSKVVVITFIRRIDVYANLLKAHRGIKVAEHVMLLFDHSVEVITHTIADRKIARDSPVILHKRAERLDADLALRTADENVSA